MRAEEFQIVSDGVYFWQAYAPAVKCDLSCCARRFGSKLVFIDPIPLAGLALEELAREATPAAIVLTNGNHARAAADFRQRFSIPIFSHPGAGPELGLAVDREISDGETVLGELTVIALPGAGPGEIALHAGSSLHVGDALLNLDPLGFSALPEKYCADARELRRSLGKLLRIEFELMTFAHGLPLVSQARRRLESLLA